jgi:cell division protein FtsB
VEPWRIVRMFLSPQTAEGGGGESTDDNVDVEVDADEPEAGEEAPIEEKPVPEPKPKPKGKPKPPAKASVSAAELAEIRRKAQAYDADQSKRTEADERRQREKEAELAKTDPVKAVETVRRRLETASKAKDSTIAELTKRVDDLTSRLHKGVLDTGLKEAIASAARDAKLQLKDGAVPFILKDLKDRFDVEEDPESGEYLIFDRETGKDASEIVGEMFKGAYREFFASQPDYSPSGAGGGNRRPSAGGTNGKKPVNTYSSAYKKMVDNLDKSGHRPSIGLVKPPKAT